MSAQVVVPTVAVGRFTLPLAARLALVYRLAPLQLRLAEVASVELQVTLSDELMRMELELAVKLTTLGSPTHDATGLTHCPLLALQSIASDPM